MSLLSANQGWFMVRLETGDVFNVYSFKGKEKLNEPYEFEIELVTKDDNLQQDELLGLSALLSIYDHSGQMRRVHGSIRQAARLHKANAFTHYKIWLVPRLWYLGQNQNHRIFQNMTVEEIIEKILKEQIFLSQNVRWLLKESYAPREYCVQYAESDLYFINRLCEEEGIYFYHEHKDDAHVLCFSDASGGPMLENYQGGRLRYYQGSGQTADNAAITRINMHHNVNSDQASYREWNFEKPPLDLSVFSDEPDWRKAPVPGGLRLETYQFPHLYNLSEPGGRYAHIQLLRQLTFSQWVDGQSNAASLAPGFSFDLFDHGRGDFNAKWWLAEVQHQGEQPQVLEHEAPSERGFFYQNNFVAIPFATRFVPFIKHPKKRINALQSAIVTGPDSEEIYPDKYGRVKVHFHWDRLGPLNEHSTCWIRVADAWAGNSFGFMQLPRLGQEVMVEFMEGDPDRPVITGRVYNADNMPPWNLPSQRTLSGIQSREIKGGQRNQLVLDDTPGRVQAQFSSDHQLSQLNLGYITRIKHGTGRDDFRGEGFELRSDGWGSIRAAKGLYIGTEKRKKASSYHKDISEAANQISEAVEHHYKRTELAERHHALPEEVKELNASLSRQYDEIAGEGIQGEFTSPQIVVSSPAGLALTTPESIHSASGLNLAVTTEGNTSLNPGKSLVASALRRVSLFAYEAGMKLFAGGGKVELQAQSDNLEAIAEKVINIISSQSKIHISSPKEILLTGGGSYLRIDEAGVEFGAEKPFQSQAAAHIFPGPKSMPYLQPPLPCSSCLRLAAKSSLPFIED